jgi:hypothetical protein
MPFSTTSFLINYSILVYIVFISLIGAAIEASPYRQVYRVFLYYTISNRMLRSSIRLKFSSYLVLRSITLLALLTIDKYSSLLSLIIVGYFPLVIAK